MRLSDISHNPGPTTLRQFGGLFLLVFGGIAVWRWHTAGLSYGIAALAATAVTVGAFGLIAPRMLRWLFVGFMYLVLPIGWTVSHLVLGLTFLLLFVPIGVAFRIAGRDRLRIRRSNRESLWEEKPNASDPAQYFRQF